MILSSLLLTALLCPALPAETPKIATVIDSKKKAEFADTARPVKLAQAVKVGDRLRTNFHGAVSLLMEDGSVVRLGSNSEMTLALPEKGDGTVFGLIKGVFRAAVEKQASRQFAVKTASGVAAVKGTQYEVSTDGARTELRVLEGAVELADGAGANAVTVSAGEGALSYLDRVEAVRKLNNKEMAALRSAMARLVAQKRKAWSARVKNLKGRKQPKEETK